MALLEHRCPFCRGLFRIDEVHRGHPLRCGGCGNTFTVPANEEAPADPLPVGIPVNPPTAKPVRSAPPARRRTDDPPPSRQSRPVLACLVLVGVGLAAMLAVAVIAYAVLAGLRAATQRTTSGLGSPGKSARMVPFPARMGYNRTADSLDV